MGFSRTHEYDANRYPRVQVADGVKVVASAGTDVALSATSLKVKRVTIQAQIDNTSGVAIGGSGVDATVATGTGELLYAGDAPIEMIPEDGDTLDLADIYVDSLVSGEGVRFRYEY